MSITSNEDNQQMSIISNEDREVENFKILFNSLYYPIKEEARGTITSGDPINIERLKHDMIPSVRNRIEGIIELFLKNNFGPSFLVNLYSFMLYHPLIQEDLVFIEDTEERLRRDPSLSRSNIVSPDEQEGIEKIRLLISDLYEPILDKIRSAYTNLDPADAVHPAEIPLEERRLLDMSHMYPRVGDGRNQRKRSTRTNKKRSTRTNKRRSTRTNKRRSTRTNKTRR